MPQYLIEADSYQYGLLRELQQVLAPGLPDPKAVWLDEESSRFFTLADAERYYNEQFFADMKMLAPRYLTSAERPAIKEERLRPWEEIDQQWFCYQLLWTRKNDPDEPEQRLAIRPHQYVAEFPYRDLERQCFKYR